MKLHVRSSADIKPTLTVEPQTSVFIGDTVTLICEVYPATGWEFIFRRSSQHDSTETTGTKTIKSVQVSDGGEYKCIGRKGENPQVYTQYSEPITVTVQKRPTPQVSVWPADHVYEGETVNLTCVINEGGVSSWQYSWYKDDSIIQQKELQYYKISSVTESDAGKYTCRGNETRGSRYSHISNAVTLTVSGSKPKLRSDTEGSVLTGNTMTLRCHIDHWSSGWKFYWYNNTQNTEKTTTETNSYTIHSVKISDGGQYWCRAGRGKPDYYTDYSDGLWINVTERPKPVVSVDPDTQLFRGETVTLRCDIQDTGDTEWTYSWTVEPYNLYIVNECNKQECKVNNIQYYHSGKYTCRGKIREQNTEMSDAVILTVSSDKRPSVLSVSPQQWLTEGDSVTLMCEVINSSTSWTFSWFTVQSLYSDDYQLVSNSSGGSKGIYTVSSVTVKHTGVYMCRAERGDPVYHTEYSNTQTLWITGVSPSVSLIIRPNRSQHFSSKSLFLSCEDHSKSTGWTVRRYKDELESCSSSDTRSTGTTSTCTIRSLHRFNTGVYWCQSESGEKLHPVNISVHNVDVILDSPVHPVTEGDPLTLRCLYRYKNSSNLRAEFYKDGSVVQNQTTGDMMIIPTVSKSHEGFYYCKHPERGESPKSWISVRDATGSSSLGLIVGLCLGLSVVFFIFFLILLWCYKNKKVSQSPLAVSQQQNISQTSDQKQTEDVYNPLQSGDAHLYDSINTTNNKDTSTVIQAGHSDAMYSEANFKNNKLESKDNVSESADLTYADIELKPRKEMKKEKKGNNSEDGDTVYSKLKKP
ncbi:cell adhesion molecule CEACAM5-like [Misgurnus anguillicaudatus]|uniref:cell adhesion molecule CEACAM5-like n=1 Tax=Misgurnus anguillicaudatus TaxID=75329 RepID=UPI003CCFA26C